MSKEFLDKMYNIHDERFEMLTDYINSTTKIDFKCNLCNNIIHTSPRCILTSKNPCKYCRSYTIDKMRQYLLDNNINDYRILSNKYINSHTMYEFKHSCGRIFKRYWKDFKRGYRCSCKNGNIEDTLKI